MMQLATLTVITVASLRSLPAAAEYGLRSIALYLIPALFFLVPTALVAAELATGWAGGVYVWVREAIGDRWGFLAVWLQWIQNVVWYPSQLAYCGAAIGFMIGDDTLGNSGLYTAVIILVFYWLSTFITLAGGNLFARVGTWGGWIGTIIPGIILIALGIAWVATGQHSQTPITWSALNPFTMTTTSASSGSGAYNILGIFAPFVLIVSNFLAYAGMEVNAVHINQMNNPNRDYPRAIFIATGLILLVFVIPTVAVAMVVPVKDLGLTTGINEAFMLYFKHWNISWITPLISAMLVTGAIASVVAWIAGPSKGLLTAARNGLLPPRLQKRNTKDAPVAILISQGFIVTALASIFLIPGQSVSAMFFMLTDMAVALYLIMYMMMFAAVLILRKKKPDVARAYRVPAVKLVAGTGFVASAAAFLIGFIPPSQLPMPGMPGWTYPLSIIGVIIVLGVPPLIFYALRKPDWKVVYPTDQNNPQ
jgi:amino acid transporter